MGDSEVFELELVGGATERRYRAQRPEIEAMPWGSIPLQSLPADVVLAARRDWTAAAFQEHRTGAQCAATLRALVECRAPIDLVACFARFPLDELAHVELAARMAMELGGAVELLHTNADFVKEPAATLHPLLRAAELVVRTFCVGEALSIPLLHGAWQSAKYPLSRAVLGRIVRDEAAHGIVGWTFLDWVSPHLDADDFLHLARIADDAIGNTLRLWSAIAARARPRAPDGLGWMGDAAYLKLAAPTLARRVVAPLLERGVSVDRGALPADVRSAL